MKPIEDREAEQWLESLRDKSSAADNLDRVLAERLRQSAPASQEEFEEDEVNISHLKEQFLFRLRKERLASKTRLGPPQMKWVAMAAALVLAVLLVPKIADRHGTEFPIELGQPKSGAPVRYLQTGRKHFEARLSRNNIKFVAREIKAALDASDIKFAQEMAGPIRTIAFTLDEGNRTSLNEKLAPTGIELPSAGSWKIVLEEP